MFKFILDIITNEKFYLPLIFIAIALISYEIISKTIIKFSKINTKITKNKTNPAHDKRKSTIVGLINNIIKYIIAIIAVIAILNIYGVNTSSIVASLGIASVIIGLAFQDIIKDLLAGIFIIFDNAYAVGDWITIDGFTGEVISMGLKTTKIKSYTGEVMSLSNSSFTKVINYNLENPKIYLQIPFGYNEKIEKIEEVLTKVLEEIKIDKDVKNTELLGVESFEESYINYSIAIDVTSGQQFRIKRQILKKIKISFDENKIVIPYNQIDIHIEK